MSSKEKTETISRILYLACPSFKGCCFSFLFVHMFSCSAQQTANSTMEIAGQPRYHVLSVIRNSQKWKSKNLLRIRAEVDDKWTAEASQCKKNVGKGLLGLYLIFALLIKVLISFLCVSQEPLESCEGGRDLKFRPIKNILCMPLQASACFGRYHILEDAYARRTTRYNGG